MAAGPGRGLVHTDGLPWMKLGEPVTAREHRQAMVGNPAFQLSTIEMDRPGETYTVDTLDALRAGPMAGDELLFIMGADTLHTMARWKEPKRILEQVRLVVALRPGHGTVEFEALTAIDPAAAERVMVVHNAPDRDQRDGTAPPDESW